MLGLGCGRRWTSPGGSRAVRLRKRRNEMRGAVSGEALVPSVAEEWSCGWQVLLAEHGVAEPGAPSPALPRSNPTNPSHRLLLLHHFVLKYIKKNSIQAPYVLFSTPPSRLLFAVAILSVWPLKSLSGRGSSALVDALWGVHGPHYSGQKGSLEHHPDKRETWGWFRSDAWKPGKLAVKWTGLGRRMRHPSGKGPLSTWWAASLHN